MIARVVRGRRVAGLLSYLAGPGKANEHTGQRVIAGDEVVLAHYPAGPADRAQALRIARAVDRPRRAHGVEIARGHVWHCSLSLHPDEGRLSDEKWAAITRDIVDRLGYTQGPGRAACRWVAVRHGLSKAGNDHVHLVVSLVREDGSPVTSWPLRRDDGTVADTWKDFQALSQATAAVERQHGLEVLTGRDIGRGGPGITAAEHAKTSRAGVAEPERVTLARTVRAAASAADDEAEFVRRARDAGLLVRPRYAKGHADVVEGYSVARRPQSGQRPIWFGGGRLARDLTLPRLRGQWPDTPQHAAAATAEWNAAARRRPTARARPAAADPGSGAWREAAADLAQLRQRLRDLDPSDHAGWARVAGDTAGVFAVWSQRVERRPGPLAAAADQLARSAQVRAGTARPRRSAPQFRGARRLLRAVTDAGGHGGQAEALTALANLAKALHDAHLAAGDARRAQEIERAAREQLSAVAQRLDTARQPPATTAEPARATPRRPVPDPGRSRGLER